MSYPPTGDPYESPSPASGYGYLPPTADPAGAGYDIYGQPIQGYRPEQQYAGYPQQGGLPPNGYPPYAYPPPVNGLAIASLVVSVVAMAGLCGYGLGGYLGIVGLVLGVVARRQIRQRGTGGDGLALAGVIVGGIATAIAVMATLTLVALFARA
jgi:hypothetical protein